MNKTKLVPVFKIKDSVDELYNLTTDIDRDNLDLTKFIENHIGLIRDENSDLSISIGKKRYVVEFQWKGNCLVTLKKYDDKTISHRYELDEFIFKFYNPIGLHKVREMIFKLM